MHNLQNHQASSASIKSSKKFLKDQGNIHIEELNQIIVSPLTGKPDLLAINIYSEARSWFKPKATKRNGNVIYSSKLTGRGWKTNYKYFENKYKCSGETIRKKFVLLENLGLLSRDFANEYSYSRLYNNSMSILVWKDTPFFYSEIGVEKITTTPPNLGSLAIKAGGSIQGNVDIIYSIPNNRNKEIEDSPYRAISSISREKKEYVRAGNIKTSPEAALPNLRGSSTGEVLIQPHESQESKPVDPAKTTKLRIVITAAMQTGTAKLPLPLQARGLAGGEVNTITSKLVPVPVPLPTAEQERDTLRAHQTRRQGTVSDEPKPIGATILSLLPRSVLEANSVTNTHQKGDDLQLAVETLPSNDTKKLIVPLETSMNYKEQMHTLTTVNEEDKPTTFKLPYRLEEPQWARDFKTQMNSNCGFEHEIDSWEYKAALKAMELEQDEDSKLITLTGSYFDIKDLRKKHFKVFVAKFYEILPNLSFKFEETK